jgi:mannose-6-phosphate isomerase-like protein (cupin superfamily)
MENVKVTSEEIGGNVVKDNETYRLIDNRLLNNLVLSKTILHPGMCTTGHDHPGLEEVYFFHKGSGRMQVGERHFEVKGGDIILIPDGDFHKVFNQEEGATEDLEFICVFQSYER